MPDPNRPHDGPSPSTPVLAALLLVSLALRPQLAAIGPLAGGIIDELGVSHAFVGLLTAVPVLCMGLFAPFGPLLARRVGGRRAIALATGTVALAGVLRAALPGEATMLVLTFAIGVATALAGPMLAMFVRERTPDHPVAGTAAYAGGTTLGAALAAAIVVPLSAWLGGWRGALIAVSLLSGLGVLAWLRLARRRDAPSSPGPASTLPAPGRRGSVLPRLPVRRPIVWAIGMLFGMQSWVYYGTNAWLPSMYVERGWDPALAAMLLSVSTMAGLAGIVVAPLASRRGAERRTLLVAGDVAALAGLVGIALLPGPGWAWAWAACLGGGLGILFTLVLTLPTDVAADARETGGVAAMMLLVGYLVAWCAPFVLGAVRDATGAFAAALWLMIGVCAIMLPLAWSLAPHRLRPGRIGAEAVAP